jgi:hypothetical protein
VKWFSDKTDANDLRPQEKEIIPIIGKNEKKYLAVFNTKSISKK